MTEVHGINEKDRFGRPLSVQSVCLEACKYFRWFSDPNEIYNGRNYSFVLS